MSTIRKSVSLALLFAASTACAQPFSGETIAIARDGKGIGFDDLRYSAALHRVLVPAGRTGQIVLIDPASHRTTPIAGLSAETSYGGGHGESTTSVDEGDGALYAIDRTAQQVVIIDPASRRVTARAALAGSPDYVRYVAATRELWVTEPDSERIEIFSISPLKHVAVIDVPGGPESLVIDSAGGRAYTHLWSGTSVAIDVRARSIAAKWPNRCSGSRGIAYDARSHFLLPAAPKAGRSSSTRHTTARCSPLHRRAAASTSSTTTRCAATSTCRAREARR